MTNKTIYSVEGTKIEDIIAIDEDMKKANINAEITPLSNNNTQTIQFTSGNSREVISTVKVQFLKPAVEINVEVASVIDDITTTLKQKAKVSELISILEKDNPGKSYHAEIIALGDLTKGNGYIYNEQSNFDGSYLHRDVFNEVVGQSIQEADLGLPYMGTHKYIAGSKVGGKDHLLFQYRVNEIVENGPNRTVVTSMPMIAEVKTVGSLSGGK